ncbi:hypothetical protein OC842_006493 [Tilletia horrida]|uniref:Scavenger mRNA decapping enzyme n=1 Tax=Tilletia horrida TaxID=155126 RepID=A0AAN6JNB5_9BASI|nr:hypothetical protein OC842_006493 [Tilletia horrida]
MAAMEEAAAAAATVSSLTSLAGFQLDRVLNQDARMHTASLLGSLPRSLTASAEEGSPRDAVILNIEKTHFSTDFYGAIGSDAAFARLANLGQNDIYTWLLAWLGTLTLGQSEGGEGPSRGADVKITLIRPVTETHILKYSAQDKYMVRETPEVYENVVRTWIESQPASRINWVYNILDKVKEKDSIIYEDADPQNGFIVSMAYSRSNPLTRSMMMPSPHCDQIVPDLKWDQRTLSSLYLVAIVHNRALRSLRDLTPQHLPLLKAVRDAAQRVAADRFGVHADRGPSVRCFLHYQPTHLHIHILHASFISHAGAIVGQAHLLDDVIDLLELGVDFGKRTLTYALGERHELWNVLEQARE